MSSSASPIRRPGKTRLDDFADKNDLGFDANVERYHLTLRGKQLTAALAFVAGTGFTLFGCCFICYYRIIMTDHVVTAMTKVSCQPYCLHLRYGLIR